MRFGINNKYVASLTIGKKLIGSFLIIALLLGVTSVLSSYYLKKIDATYTDLIERRAVILSNVLKTQVEISKENSLLRAYMITKDSTFLDKLEVAYNNATQLIHETQEIAHIPEFIETLQLLDRGNQAFKLKYEQLIGMIQANQSSDQTTEFFVKEVFPLGIELDPIADQLANEQLISMNEESEKSSNVVGNAIMNVAWISILAFILAIVIGYICSRIISKPLKAMAGVAERIAHGDLTLQDVKVNSQDEIGILARSFNQMSENLRNVVRQIGTSSEHVASSAEELTASAQQSSQASEMITMTIQTVSGNAELQARNVDDSVQAMNEISYGIQQIASSAQLTSSLSKETAEKAIEGNQEIQFTVQEMDSLHHTMNHLAINVTEMEEQSNQIEQIAVVITEIAAQTNLLSLNAAIEAARAGEQGRGFAVVADEVRKLAEQSSQFAGQIAQLVTTIKNRTNQVVESTEIGVKKVSDGLQAVHTAGELFEKIKQNIDVVSEQIQDISAATQEISAGTEQVVHSIESTADGSKTLAAESQNLAASTEEQLASMEEITASAASLSSMAEDLQVLVGKFKI